MKRLCIITGILLFLFVMVISIPVSAQVKSGQKMSGLTVIPSFDGPGLGYRSWVTPQWGWSLEVMPSWEFNDIIARVRYMKTLSTKENARWYGLLTAGYNRVDEEINVFGPSISYKVSMPTFGFGIGWEKLFGIRKNKGFSLEAGYQYGQADYDIKWDYLGYHGETSDTYKMSPIYIGGQLAFYF
jgi:hypothetical protein